MKFNSKLFAGLVSVFLIAQVGCEAKGSGHGGGGHAVPSVKSAPPPPAPTKIVNGNPVGKTATGRRGLGRGRGRYLGNDDTTDGQTTLDPNSHPGSNATVDPNLPASSFVKTYSWGPSGSSGSSESSK